MAFQAPVMTLAQMETAVGTATGLDTTTAGAELTSMYEALSVAAHTACTWEGRWWWFLRGSGSFTTVDATISKVARASNVTTITTAAAHNIVAGCRVYIDGVTLDDFDDADAVVVSAATTTTFTYANTGDEVSEVADTTGTVSCRGYPLKVVNAASMTDLWAPRHIWEGTRQLPFMQYAKYTQSYRVLTAGSTGQPTQYALGGDLLLFLYNMPDDEYSIYVDYIKRHSLINKDTVAADLIIPGPFHRGIYVDGAVELLKSDNVDESVLLNSKRFQETILRMSAAEPEGYDSTSGMNTLGGGGLGLPAGSQVIILSDMD